MATKLSAFTLNRHVAHLEHIRARSSGERDGLTVLVVEQNARLALDAAQHAFVLEVGEVAVSGPSSELQADESVRRSYLGY